MAHYDAAIELEEGEEERKRKASSSSSSSSSSSGSSSANASLSHARHNRGVLLARRGEHAAAVEDFDAALAALGPGALSSCSASDSASDGSGAVAALLFSRGSSLDALGRFDEAVTDYMRALSVGGNGNGDGGKQQQQQQASAAAKPPLRR